MNKKSSRNRRNIKSKDIIPSRLKNTIWSSIVGTVLIIVTVIVLIMFGYCKETIKKIENDVTSDFISNLYIFNQYQTSEEFEVQLPKLIKIINKMIPAQYMIRDIFVIDVKTKQCVFTSLNEMTYEYIPNSPTKSFKLLSLSDNKKAKYEIISFTKTYSNKTYEINMVISERAASGYSIDIVSSFFFIFIMLISSIIIGFLAHSITKPLLTMEKTISRIAQGDLSGRLEYTKYNEINQLVQSYNIMANTLQKMYSTLEMQVQDRTKELKSAYAELQNTQAMMVHSEKMKSLGELVAGIMHEINNPINFIYGNMTHLSNYSNDLIQIIEDYGKYNDSLKPEEKEDIEKLKQEIDYEFLKSDLPDLIKSCKEGAERAKNIIQDLKSFSRMEEATIVDVDIPREIDTTLNILHNKLKNKAEIHKEYDDNLPKIEAFGGQLNQVFMNILDNAAGAIKEKGDIWIRIKADNENNKLIMEFEDNGIGMDEETARKVFDPFFTTKPVGQGTGLGMSITHKIIKNHQGDIRLESQPNMGTKFIINLPINIDRENLNASLVSGETNG